MNIVSKFPTRALHAFFGFLLLLPAFSLAEPNSTKASPHEVLVLVGAPGEDSYREGFIAAAQRWQRACAQAGIDCAAIGETHLEGSKPDREKVQRWLSTLDPQSAAPAWLVYIGHGTYARGQANLNLTGPDLDAETLASWLEPLKRTFVFVHGGSASGPFLTKISGPNRIILTATEGGDQLNYARFGESLAGVITTGVGDVNQDGQVSVLEAFLSAADRVARFYEETGRIATESAMIDDNGDGRGTPFSWFSGDRVTKKSKEGLLADGFRASQIALVESEQEKSLTLDQKKRRNLLEQELEKLRSRKLDTAETDYYAELETILDKISEIYLAE